MAANEVTLNQLLDKVQERLRRKKAEDSTLDWSMLDYAAEHTRAAALAEGHRIDDSFIMGAVSGINGAQAAIHVLHVRVPDIFPHDLFDSLRTGFETLEHTYVLAYNKQKELDEKKEDE